MSKKLISLFVLLCMILLFSPVRQANADTLITNAPVTIITPVAGAFPDYAPMFPASAKYESYGNEYEWKNGVIWHDETIDYFLDPETDCFDAGHVYTVEIKLRSKSGYVFSNDCTATVNGKAATVRYRGDDQTWIQLAYTFPAVGKKTYTVTLNANGGSCSKSSITVTYDKAYGTLPTPTRTGYTFEGWWTTKATGGKQVTASTVCKATGNYTLYARWTAKKYTVTLNANGGSCSKSSITVTYDNAYGTLPTPTRSGYTFACWWTTKATGGKQVTASTVCYATGNYTLYARWTAKTYTVTLNANGGTCSKSSITVTYDKAYGTLPTPTRTGYAFDGWWTTKATGGKRVYSTTVCKATGNYTLYAHWTAN